MATTHEHCKQPLLSAEYLYPGLGFLAVLKSQLPDQLLNKKRKKAEVN